MNSTGFIYTDHVKFTDSVHYVSTALSRQGDLVAEWLACWTQAQKGLGSNRSRDAVG